MYCSGGDRGAWIEHSDQYRGLRYCYTRQPDTPGSTSFAEPSTDYFQYLDTTGPGLEVVGYGFRSIDHIIAAILRVESAPESERSAILDEIGREAMISPYLPRRQRGVGRGINGVGARQPSHFKWQPALASRLAGRHSIPPFRPIAGHLANYRLSIFYLTTIDI